MRSLLGPGRAAIGAVIAVCLLSGCGSDGDGGSGPTLTIGGWGGVIDDATERFYFDPFAEAGGPDARFVDAPGTQLAQVEAQSKAGDIEWDAIDSVPGDAAFILDRKRYLAHLPPTLHQRLVSELGADRVTPFGFAHGNIGNVIACNMDRMDDCPDDMAEFFDVERFPESRAFSGYPSIMALTTAQVASGVPAGETSKTPLDLDAAFAQLDRIKPKVKVFWQSGDQQEQILRSGAVDMGIIWSNRAYSLIADGVDVEVNWADGAYEPSYWTVLEDAPNKRAAFDLLEWIGTNSPAQADWAREIHSSTPHPESIDSLPASLRRELADDPANFDQLAIPNFEWYAEHTAEANARYREFVRGG
jgi:putative spermidine/putrescine transport system substrate-binding protein